MKKYIRIFKNRNSDDNDLLKLIKKIYKVF